MKIPFQIIPIAAAILVGGGAFAFSLSRPSDTPQVAAVGQATSTTTPIAVAAAPSGTHLTPDRIESQSPPRPGDIEYRNEKYHFSFYHSPQSTTDEHDEGGGAMTITLENLVKVRGFQVFIVPYSESAISEARFKQDVPSGVRENVENTSLDGVRAVTFTSRDAVLGDTREIWVIRGGYLYEITTLAGTANWFDPIISTWKFI